MATKRLVSSAVTGLMLALAFALPATAHPKNVAVIEDVSCDNGETVDIAFVLGTNPHSVFFVLDGGKVLPLMSYVFTDVATGDVLLAASHPISSKQPTTTCTGVDPNFDPNLGIVASFTLEVVFVPAR